ncbi:MAG: twin-arginine translocase TatA/TatE family subunit [Bacteroidetes bacterium]|jgi:sec-independent protein translocase protein TatA|nr:twin-arginine translocase TatA/TatE family subunit [Bacteroidota bacterium]MBT5529968.1 twin-arginine translocase TatA/TatE family subunit [Cytophagia bacterium]MBT3422742.1 twin-arginine translocase TatA/TatE family subunit [Bacteroidota bacterium]MBT3802740.1 twin-arginine translocase TatA/TatE family subunit [Bacteroidota bacterium]MBT3933585.1 twin-arginine translocase TatA/TatE family subunit [Bacteroidota bacterium]
MTEFILAGWFGTWEIVIIFAALLLLFGGRKIPELMKGIGKGVREFNDAKDKVKANIEEGMKSKESEEKSEDEENKDK